MEKYIVNGQGYNVKPEDLNAFLQKFPNAKKYVPGKTNNFSTKDPSVKLNVTGSTLAPGSSEQPKAEDIARSTAMGAFYESGLPSNIKKGMTIVNVIKALPQIATDSEERAELGKFLKNRLDNVPEAFQSAYYSAIATGADLFTADLDNLGYNEKQKEYREKAEKVIIEQYEKLDELEFKDTGTGIVAGAKEGDAASLIAGVFGAGVSMAETAIPAALTFGASLPIQVAAPMYTDYNRAKAKALYGDDPNAIEKLVENDQTEIAIPLALGAVATGLEYIGWKGVDDYIRAMPGKGTQLAKLLWTGSREGFTEVGQLGAEKLNENLGAGKSIKEASKIAWDAMASDEGLEMWLNGFLGASQMSTVGNVVNRALRSDNASIKEINNKINNLADLNNKKYNTRNKEVKDAINLEIQEAEQDLKNYINEKRKLNKVLTADEKTSLINVLKEKDGIKEKVQSLKTQLENKEISNKEFGYAIRGLNNQDKKLNDQLSETQSVAVKRAAEEVTKTVRKQVGAIADEQGVEGTVTEATSQEIIDMQGQKLARLTAERDSNQEVIDDPNQTAENKKIAEENVKDLQQQINDVENADTAFGYIDEKIDDKGDLTGDFEIIINKDKPMIGTAAHEFMHKVLFKTLKGNKDLQTNVGDAVTTFINEEKGGFDKPFINRMSAYINPIKDKNGKFVRDEDGNVQYEKVSEFGEEVVTVMSESILDGSLKYNENLFTKLGDIIRQNLQRYGFKSIQFNSGRDVYNFIKDFNKSIEKGYISEAITEVAVKGAKGKLVEGKKKAKPKAKRKMSKVSPRADQFIKAEINNEMLVDIVNSPSSSKEDSFGAIEALIEKNWPVISKALKFNPTGEISMQSIKEAISEQMMGIFPKITLPDGKTINREGKRLLDTYNREQKVTTFLDATLRPRQAEILTRAKTIDATSQGVSLDEAKNIAVSTELENATSNQQDTRKRINVLKIPKVAKVAKDIRQDTKVVEGDTHKQVTKNNEGHIGNKIFNIPENKITKPNQNLTTSDDIVDVKTGDVITKEELDAGKTGILSPSESKSVQDVFSDYETSEQFIKILPKTNVSEKDALINEIGEKIPVSRNVYGRAIGLQDRILEYFYEPLFKPNGKRARSQGKTSQVPLWTLKEQFINPKKDVVVQFQRDLGITEQKEVNILPTEEQRSIIGQLLKGAARTLSQQVSLSAAQRVLEARGASPQQIADVTAGQRRRAYSKDSEIIFGGIKSLLSEKKGEIFDDNLLQFVSTYVGVNEAKMSDNQKAQVMLSEDVEALEIALDQAYGNSFTKQEKSKIANEIKKQVAKLGLKPKTKNIVKQQKIVDQILKSTEAARIKVAKVTGSNITAAKAQNDIIRQETRRRSDGVYFKRLFDKNKEQAIADLIMIGGHSHTSGKIGEGRGQYYKNVKDFYDTNLGKVGVKPVYKTFKRAGKTVYELNVEATAKKNNLKTIPVTKASQSVAGAIKDHLKALAGNKVPLENRRAHEKHARRVLNEYVAFNVEQYKAGLQDNVDIMLMMTSLLSNMNSVLARAGALNLVQENIKLGRYEHGHPRVAVLIRLIIEHVNKGGVKNINSFFKNYDVNIIDLNFDDAITDAGYKEVLADGQTFDDPSWFRMYNEKTLGDKRLKRLVEAGTKKVPKEIESFMKANDLLKENIKEINTIKKATIASRKSSKDPKGITVLDFDDTLATTKSLIRFTAPDGTTGTLNAEEYASTYEDLLEQGYTFDFSEFNKVVKGKIAPLFQKALKLQKKFGPENMFVLTARPPAAQKPIYDFLKANGLNIPLKNITGLGNSTAEAKALWIAEKVGEGYNDFYFADDALQNVQAVKNMLDQFDVKSKVQQAKVKFSKDMDVEFNKILEEVTGIEFEKRFSETKARKRGADKGKFRFFIPPSHEDFAGLLYNFMGKGKRGNEHRNFFEQALIKPLNRAYREIDAAKQAVANDYKSLNKQFPDVKKKLIKNTPDGDFTFQDAIRVYLWNKHGYTIPGLSNTDQASLVELVMSDSQLKAYAETLNVISKQEAYVDPGPNWETGNIRIDLVDATGRVGRAGYFNEFNENTDIIFSQENLNKIEAGYGKAVREALEDMLHRIKTGINRPKGASAKPNMFMNWLNASVSGVMFFNTRSALLQQMSNVNYLNFADNNIFAAGKAFANQPQYWKDFAMIFNSDMLKQRRGGLQTDINGAELAEAIKKARPGNLFDQAAIIVGKALRLGFLPTQIGDNIAIATGGAAFYRNRVNKYIKEGMSVKEAEAAAFTDFQDITQATQQSALPHMTSKQQAMWIGKLVLNFLNTPSQYNRIIKKAGSDILNRRITPPNTTQMQSDMSNASRILYYGAAQNLIFYSLQTALFAVMFGLGDEDEEKNAEQILKKKERVVNGAIDTILRGSGIYGVAVSTLKNMMIKFLEQREKGYNKDESAVIMEMLNFSPVVGIKARKIVNAEKTLNYNKKIIDEMNTFDIDNPMWSAVTNYIEVAGPPANRIYQKTINLRNATDNDYTALQRALFVSGYTTWSLGLGDTKKMQEIKESVKEKKKTKKKQLKSKSKFKLKTKLK
tara:strand:- start:1123 stop:8775 length:7653 start_codon:yes stop_codon:yes gene_type:complete